MDIISTSNTDERIEMIEIDSNCTFLEFMKKAAAPLGLEFSRFSSFLKTRIWQTIQFQNIGANEWYGTRGY